MLSRSGSPAPPAPAARGAERPPRSAQESVACLLVVPIHVSLPLETRTKVALELMRLYPDCHLLPLRRSQRPAQLLDAVPSRL